MTQVQEDAILTRITVNPDVFGGKPIIRGHRVYAKRLVAHERVEPAVESPGA